MNQIAIRSDKKRVPKKDIAYDAEINRRVKELQAYKGEK